MSKVILENYKAQMTAQRLSTARVIKAFGDKQSSENQQKLDDAIAPLNDRLDKLDLIDSEDGFNSALERMKTLEDFLAGAGNLQEVLDSIKLISDDLSALTLRVENLETLSDTNKKANELNASNIATLNTKVDTQKTDLQLEIVTALTTGKTYTDEEIAKLHTTVTDAINDGGDALVALKQRVQKTEDTLNDTEVEGVTVKGVVSKLNDLISLVETNRVQAKADSDKALADAKKYVDDNYLTNADVLEATTNICDDENAMREILGLQLIDCSISDNGGLNG